MRVSLTTTIIDKTPHAAYVRQRPLFLEGGVHHGDAPTTRTRVIDRAFAAPQRDAGYQAFLMLRIAFAVAPIAFGLDKFFNVLTDWPQYLAGVGRRPHARQRAGLHVRRRRDRDRRRRAGRGAAALRRARRRRLARRDHLHPAHRPGLLRRRPARLRPAARRARRSRGSRSPTTAGEARRPSASSRGHGLPQGRVDLRAHAGRRPRRRGRTRSPGSPRASWRSAAAPSAAGSARPRPSVRRVPHLDDRRAAYVEAHERAAADLVDDGVRERRARCPRRRPRRRSRRRRCSRSRRARATARGGRGTRRWPRRVELRRADEPALAAEVAGAIAARASPAGATARRRGSGGSAGTARDGDRGRGARRRAERDVGAAVLQRLGERRAGSSGGDRDLQRLVARREQLDQRPDVLGDQRRRGDDQPARLAPTPRPTGGPARPAPRISVASAASRRPPGVSAIPRPLRTNSSSPSSLRSAATATDTAGSVTSSSAAAALTDPWRATSTKDCSWARVISDRLGPVDRATITPAICRIGGDRRRRESCRFQHRSGMSARRASSRRSRCSKSSVRKPGCSPAGTACCR